MTYEEILRELDDALGVCRALGLGRLVEHGRFSQYRRRIERLVRVVGAKPNGGLSPRDEGEFLGHIQEYLVALSEGFELSEIMAHLRSIPAQTMVEKLRPVLKGPLLPGEETKNSNDARNFLFELNVAARLRHAGFEPALGEQPDIRCKAAGKDVFIECKRPLSELGLEDCVKSAGKQLQANLPQAPSGVGIVAISLSKTLNPAFRPVRVGNTARAQALLVSALESVAASVGAVCARFYGDPRLVGIFFHVIAVFENVETNRYEVGQQFLAYPFALPADEAYAALGEGLKQTAHGMIGPHS